MKQIVVSETVWEQLWAALMSELDRERLDARLAGVDLGAVEKLHRAFVYDLIRTKQAIEKV